MKLIRILGNEEKTEWEAHDAMVKFLGKEGYYFEIYEIDKIGSDRDCRPEDDPLVAEVKKLVEEEELTKLTVNRIQREYKIGFARAARIMDILREEGFVE